MRRKLLAAICVAFFVIAIHAVSQASTLESTPQPIGNGNAHTYVELDDSDNLTEIGVILSDTALSNLPDSTHESVFQLPPQASTTAITHIGLNWQSHGHMPPGIYSPPHFDIHAYIITPEERNGITVTGDDLEKAYTRPADELIPTGYIMAPDSAEPNQGSHWIDPTADEFQGIPHGFKHTLIYGFYNGEMSFIEPMVTLEFLQSQQEFEGAIARPTRYTRTGTYPTTYRISYNATTGNHIIALTNFTS